MTQEWLEGHRARKRFGQNFLHDQHWISRIAKSIDAKAGDVVVEIGPGQAALTRELISTAEHIHAVEIDNDLAAFLKTKFEESQLTLIQADALTIDWANIIPGQCIRVVGNLPYNISSPLLFALMSGADRVIDQHFMLQREVVDRMVATPGTKTYGRLSVMLQYRYKMSKLFDVPPGAFVPAPKVVSSIVRMIPKKKEDLLPVNEKVFSDLVAAAFQQRRKTIRNSISEFLTAEEISSIGIDPTARAEVLTVEDFVKLTNLASAK